MNTEIKKIADVLISLSNDYLAGNLTEALFVDMVDVTVKHMKITNEKLKPKKLK